MIVLKYKEHSWNSRWCGVLHWRQVLPSQRATGKDWDDLYTQGISETKAVQFKMGHGTYPHIFQGL